ncbi:MAG: c-type cytochrome [Gemmatimonadales bacterium]
MRVVSRILIAILAVAILAFGIVFLLGGRSLSRRMELPPEEFAVGTADSARLGEGQRLATVYQCRSCHGEKLSGTSFIEGMPFMNLPAPNLTAGGIGATLTDLQWERAIRHGVGADGRSLLIMPVEAFTGLSDDDLGAIVAYLRTLPAESTELISRSVGPAGRAAALFAPGSIMPGRLIDHAAPHPGGSAAGPGTVAHGEYLGRMCRACHGADYGGMKLAFADGILAPDLTARNGAGMSAWTEEQFVAAMRQGVRPDGRALSEVMPWRAFGQYSPEELGALWQYLTTLPPATSVVK